MEQPKKKTPKWLKITGIVLLALFVIGLITPDKDASSGSSTDDVKATAAAAEKKQYDRFKSNEVVGYYEDNEVSADEIFKGKTFVVEGTIRSIGKDILDKPYITLTTDGQGYRDVQCTFVDKNEVAKLSKGQAVAVKGECRGLMMNVQMKDCTLNF
jgi:hypothetical protein